MKSVRYKLTNLFANEEPISSQEVEHVVHKETKHIWNLIHQQIKWKAVSKSKKDLFAENNDEER